MPLTIVWVNERNVCNTIIGGTMWVPKLETGFSKPEALVRALKRAIESGELKVNDRLPAQRELAYALGLNLSTVSRAMVEACTFVRSYSGRRWLTADSNVAVPPTPIQVA